MQLDVNGFTLQLRVGRRAFETAARDVLAEAAQMAAETLVIGSRFGPGAPGPDTGFLRASFRVGLGGPASGPSDPPPGLRGESRGGAALYPPVLETARLANPTVGVAIYCTTSARYGRYLEGSGKRRRTGPTSLRGSSTDFVSPVERAWPRMVMDAARRYRGGRRGGARIRAGGR